MEKIKYFLRTRNGFMIVILLTMIIFAGSLSSNFLNIDNLMNIFLNNIVLGIMALGMTVVILTSGIDVSVGSQLGFIAVSIGLFSTSTFSNPIIVILFGILTGISLGLINGLLTSIIEIPPIVATLGTLSIFRGAILMKTNGKWVTDIPIWIKEIYNYKFLGIKIPIYIYVLIFILTYFILNKKKVGRNIYAYGGNKIAASRAGVDKNIVNIFAFGFMGLTSGIASLLYISQLGMVEPNAGSNFEMNVIAAVIIGGTSIFGGMGSIFGTLLGVILLGILQNAMVLIRIETYWQDVVMGSIIIGTVCLDMYKKKKLDSHKFSIEIEEEKGVNL